jgi:hypothetical protein
MIRTLRDSALAWGGSFEQSKPDILGQIEAFPRPNRSRVS